MGTRRLRLLPDSKDLSWTPYVWLIYSLLFIAMPALKRAPAWEWAVTVAAYAVFLGLYFGGFWLKGAKAALPIVGIAAIGYAFAPLNPGAGAMPIYAGSFAGYGLRPRRAIPILIAVAGLWLFECWWLSFRIEQWLWPPIFTVLVGVLNTHYAENHRRNEKLRVAQEQVEYLAKVAERERIARDLHDVLGHTLSSIVLKSELAARLVERDPARAGTEMREVETIAREALAEVRGAIRGYRAASLPAEIDNAARLLESAGITVRREIERVSLPAAHETVLALAVREAATNVVRHAAASTCTLSLVRENGHARLTVVDDGRGGAAVEGSGLEGMRERAMRLGGRVERDGSHGTRLVIELPVPSATDAPAGPSAQTRGDRGPA